MAKFHGIGKFTWGTVAIMMGEDRKVFNINIESLKERIKNLRVSNGDTSEEERALKYLEEALE